jgi:2-polyprenyl-6-methoxyphenol hydroxylase-like FAD-dependent oxidoreductase
VGHPPTSEGLTATDDGKRVTGARVSHGRTPATTLPADLIVDATGRTSAAPTWLEELGWSAPPEISVNARWGYASRFYRADDDLIEVAPVGHRPLGLAGGDSPTRTRGGFVLPQDGGRWILTLYGCAKDYPPTDQDGFQAFADTLGLPEIGEVVRHGEALSPIRQSRTTTNRLRLYEQLSGRPEAFLCIGDTVSSLNPAYGQGMTVAALGALDLRAELEQQRELEPSGDLTGLAERFQARLAQTNQFPWGVSAGGDYRVDGVAGDPPPEGTAERAAFSDRLEALSSEDLELNLKLNETFQMVRSPAWIEQDVELRERILADWERLGHMVKAADLGYR